jgi:hypothetical protein
MQKIREEKCKGRYTHTVKKVIDFPVPSNIFLQRIDLHTCTQIAVFLLPTILAITMAGSIQTGKEKRKRCLHSPLRRWEFLLNHTFFNTCENMLCCFLKWMLKTWNTSDSELQYLASLLGYFFLIYSMYPAVTVPFKIFTDDLCIVLLRTDRNFSIDFTLQMCRKCYKKVGASCPQSLPTLNWSYLELLLCIFILSVSGKKWNLILDQNINTSYTTSQRVFTGQ